MKLESNVCHAVVHFGDVGECWRSEGECWCTPYGALYCLSRGRDVYYTQSNRASVQSIHSCPAQRWAQLGALTGIKRTNFPEKGRFGERQDVRTGREQGLGNQERPRNHHPPPPPPPIHHHPFIPRTQQALACMDALYGRSDSLCTLIYLPKRSAEIEMCCV